VVGRRNTARLVALAVALNVGGTSVPAADNPRVSLLELYTSEGCNSCPPADRRVSQLPRPRLVPDKLVVLAFHVDYWNYLGWPDRFSQPRFTERQRAVARANRARTIYTPQLVLNGRDFRDAGNIETRVARSNSQPTAIRLALNAERGEAALKISVVATPTGGVTDKDIELYVAVYENNLTTEVKTGENRGERLRHDYVVRTLLGPVPLAAGKPTRWSGEIPVTPDWKPGDLGVAAFVQAGNGGEVLQAAAREWR
jgi:hypothetical protein